MSDWRLIITDPANAFYNMALDEALLKAYPKQKIPTLRIYSWSPDSISIGANQKPENSVNIENCLADRIDVVRRITGGQAIYHSNELTYSVVAAIEDLGASISVKDSYKKICNCIINAYQYLGLEASFAYQQKGANFYKIKTELCFASREDCDIVINNRKIGGNAQKRQRHALLQHGSIPFSYSEKKLHNYIKNINNNINSCSASLNDLSEKKYTFKDVQTAVTQGFKKSYKFSNAKGLLTDLENFYTTELLNNKYLLDKYSINKVSLSNEV